MPAITRDIGAARAYAGPRGISRRRGRPRVALSFRGLAFAGFLCAGAFKASPRLAWLPVDLTLSLVVVSMLIAGGLVVQALLARDRARPRGSDLRTMEPMAAAAVLFLFFALPMLGGEHDAYSIEKTTRLFTLTLVAAVLPLALFRTRGDLERFCNALAVLGLIMAVDASATLLTGHKLTEQTHGRASAWGASPLQLGRVAGLAAVWIVVRWLDRRAPLLLVAPAVGALLVAVVGSGSRGPLLAVSVAITVSCLLFYLTRVRTAARVLLGLAICGGFLVVGMRLAPDAATERIARTVSGDFSGSSEEGRARAYERSLKLIPAHPLGIGWGGFADLNVKTPSGAPIDYPHNFVLEAFLEGGWLVGVLLSALVLGALVRAASLGMHGGDVAARGLFAVLLYLVVNALVSGDINGNRYMLTFVVLALAYRGVSRAAGPAPGAG